MNDGFQSAADALHHEIAKLSRQLDNVPPLPRRSLLFELCRTVDSWFVINSLAQNKDGKSDETNFLLATYGWPKVLASYLNEPVDDTMPLHSSTDLLQQWAIQTIKIRGTILACERLIELCERGLLTVRINGNELQFTASQEWESFEKEDLEWLSNMADKAIVQVAADFDAIRPRMEPLVSIWRDNYIQYSTTLEISEYFEKSAICMSHKYFGQETFDGESLFGGQSFNLYRATALVLTQFNLQHIAFCHILLNKSSVKMENILTIFSRIDDLTESIASALDCSYAEASQAVTLFSTSANCQGQNYSESYAAPQAPLILASHKHVIRSLYGGLGAPFQFMLAALRGSYRQDWDREVNERERLFRNDLIQLLAHDHLRWAQGVVRVDTSLGKTDIDAAVFDPKNNTLGLFQLKWQDAFGSCLRSRESKKKNFVKESERWLQLIDAYLNENGIRDLSQKMKLQNLIRDNVRVRLFVIGRYHSCFSDVPPSYAAAYANWATCVRLIAKARENLQHEQALRDPINWLHSRLLDEHPSRRVRREPVHTSLKVGDLVVSVSVP